MSIAGASPAEVREPELLDEAAEPDEDEAVGATTPAAEERPRPLFDCA